MSKAEAQVVDFADERQRRGRTSKQTRMPPVVSQAVALIKQKEAQALEGALMTQDGAKAETLRAVAAGLDMAATLVLVAFDNVTRKPSL